MPPHPVFKSGNTALITGAASGIGLAVAELCRKHGMNLPLVDNNTTNLSTAKDSLQGNGETEMYPMDVSKLDEWKDLKAKVEKRFKGLHLLMLNAGIGIKGNWEDVEYFRTVNNKHLFSTRCA